MTLSNINEIRMQSINQSANELQMNCVYWQQFTLFLRPCRNILIYPLYSCQSIAQLPQYVAASLPTWLKHDSAFTFRMTIVMRETRCGPKCRHTGGRIGGKQKRALLKGWKVQKPRELEKKNELQGVKKKAFFKSQEKKEIKTQTCQ